jgi:hypothetical protein
MKKTVILIALLLCTVHAGAEVHILTLRASYHPDFLRIVLEGSPEAIGKRFVYQRGKYVLVTFPDTTFSIQSEQNVLTFKRVNRETVMFSPGEFRGLKVFTLDHPSRLVIDVFVDQKNRIFSDRSEEEREPLSPTETIVIDPGHGGYENGITFESFKEKNIVLDISKKLAALVNKGSAQSSLTRNIDRYLSMSDRVKHAHSAEADLFISIHVGNHSNFVLYAPLETERASDDFEEYRAFRGQQRFRTKTLTLIKAMKEALVSGFGEDMVAIRPVPYSILSKVDAAAVIVELPSFADANYIEELNTEVAGALYRGLYIYDEIKTR